MKLNWISAGLCLFALAGCSLLPGHETPQQKFFAALARGNGTGASNIWLQMSPEDKAKLQRGEEARPLISKDQAQSELLRHERESSGTDQDQQGVETLPMQQL